MSAEKEALRARILALSSEVGELRGSVSDATRRIGGEEVALPAVGSLHLAEVTAFTSHGCFVALPSYGSARVALAQMAPRRAIELRKPSKERGEPGVFAVTLTAEGANADPASGWAVVSETMELRPEDLVAVGAQVWVEVTGSDAGQVYASMRDVSQHNGARLAPLPARAIVGSIHHGIVACVATNYVLVALPGVALDGVVRPVAYTGLLHKDKMSHKLGPHFDRDLLEVGDALWVKVLSVEEREGGERRTRLTTKMVSQADGVDHSGGAFGGAFFGGSAAGMTLAQALGGGSRGRRSAPSGAGRGPAATLDAAIRKTISKQPEAKLRHFAEKKRKKKARRLEKKAAAILAAEQLSSAEADFASNQAAIEALRSEDAQMAEESTGATEADTHTYFGWSGEAGGEAGGDEVEQLVRQGYGPML